MPEHHLVSEWAHLGFRPLAYSTPDCHTHADILHHCPVAWGTIQSGTVGSGRGPSDREPRRFPVGQISPLSGGGVAAGSKGPRVPPKAWIPPSGKALHMCKGSCSSERKIVFYFPAAGIYVARWWERPMGLSPPGAQTRGCGHSKQSVLHRPRGLGPAERARAPQASLWEAGGAPSASPPF